MGVTLVPDRILADTTGVDPDGSLVKLWRTEWWLRGEMISATPYARSPRQAIRDGVEADRGYQQVLVRDHATAA